MIQATQPSLPPTAAAGFAGRCGIVMGAASGIGRAAAKLFAAAGALVLCCDSDQAKGEQVVAEIVGADGRADLLVGDVAILQVAEAAVARALSIGGRLDFAFNDAGIDGRLEPLTDLEERDWDRVLDVNAKGVWAGMKYQLRQMIGQKPGAIVNTGSTASFAGFRTMSAYVASKHAVIGLTKAAALEASSSGVRVNCLCPRIIESSMTAEYLRQNPPMREIMDDQQPLGRTKRPAEAARLAVWLCSDEASFVTGASFVVDGGLSAQFSSHPEMPASAT